MRSVTLAAVTVGLLVVLGASAFPVPDGLDGVVDRVSVARDPDNALRGTVELHTREPTTLVLDVDGPRGGWRIAETTAAATDHRIPLLQLLPDTRYDLHLTAADADGTVVGSGSLGRFTTAELPDDLPPVTVDVAGTAGMTPGVTVFNTVYADAPERPSEPDQGFLTAVDEQGRVVWYERDRLRIGDTRRLPNGDLLYASTETGARRMTPSGEVVAEWRGTSPSTDRSGVGEGLDPGEVIHLDVHSIHHEVAPTGDGAMVGLSRPLRTIRMDDPCDDVEAPTDVDVVGDSIVVFDAETGDVLAEHSLFDVVDPREDADDDWCTDFLDPDFPEADPRDWSHANAVIEMDGGRTWLVSYRHLDELIAFRAVDEPEGPAGSIRWRMGPTDTSDFRMLGDGQWFWHQHAPELQPDGSLMVYDNGNGRTDAPEPFSRAVRYEVDTQDMTVRQVWEHRMPDGLYASFLGDADVLDGTVLITHGGQFAPCPREDVDDSYWFGQIVEVDEATGDIVWQITTRDDEDCTGWAIYRAERIPTLYPPEFDVTAG